jgi:serine/threonine protein kinase
VPITLRNALLLVALPDWLLHVDALFTVCSAGLKENNSLFLPGHYNRSEMVCLAGFICVHTDHETIVQEAMDVWSLGVMMFELLTGQPALRMTEGKDKVRHAAPIPCIFDTAAHPPAPHKP